jgi:hypothetical protein
VFSWHLCLNQGWSGDARAEDPAFQPAHADDVSLGAAIQTEDFGRHAQARRQQDGSGAISGMHGRWESWRHGVGCRRFDPARGAGGPRSCSRIDKKWQTRARLAAIQPKADADGVLVPAQRRNVQAGRAAYRNGDGQVDVFDMGQLAILKPAPAKLVHDCLPCLSRTHGHARRECLGQPDRAGRQKENPDSGNDRKAGSQDRFLKLNGPGC